MTPELEALLRAAITHAQHQDEASHHALVLQAMAVGRQEAYDRDQAIYELAKLVAKLSTGQLDLDHG